MIDIDFTLGIQAINFFVLLIILNSFLFKPILRVANARSRKMSELKQSARQSIKSGERALGEYEERLAKMRHESSEIVAKARKEAAAVSTEIIEKAQIKFNAELEAARKELVDQVETASAQLKKEMTGLAETLAGTVLGRKI